MIIQGCFFFLLIYSVILHHVSQYEAFLAYGELGTVPISEPRVSGLGTACLWKGSWCDTSAAPHAALPASGFCIIILDQVHPGCDSTSSEEQWGRCSPRENKVRPEGWQRLALLWIKQEIRLWGGRVCAEWNTHDTNCRAQRRFVIWISLAFLLIPSKVIPFSLSSSASIATKSIPTPCKWLEQGILPVRVSTAGWKTVSLPEKSWMKSTFAFPLKFSVSLWNNVKHKIYVKNENISNQSMVSLQNEHFPKEEDESV